MKRILITGGAGFVGKNLVDYILKNTDWEVNIIDNLSNGDFDSLRGMKSFQEHRVGLYRGDIIKEDEVKESIEGCNYVVNLAAQVGVISSVENPKHDAEVNISGLLNVLEAAKKEGVEKLIQASSAAPLGEVDPPVSEEDVPKPLSPYGASKLAGEGYCSAYADSFNLNTVALRFSNIYGPRSMNKGSAIHKFIKRILEDKGLTVYGSGEQTRDFIHVKDVCKGIYKALTTEMKNGFELIHLGTGKETSVNEVIQTLKKISDKPVEVKHEEKRSGEIMRNCTDPSKAERVLNFKPKTGIKEGLVKTFKWFSKKYNQGDSK